MSKFNTRIFSIDQIHFAIIKQHFLRSVYLRQRSARSFHRITVKATCCANTLVLSNTPSRGWWHCLIIWPLDCGHRGIPGPQFENPWCKQRPPEKAPGRGMRRTRFFRISDVLASSTTQSCGLCEVPLPRGGEHGPWPTSQLHHFEFSQPELSVLILAAEWPSVQALVI